MGERLLRLCEKHLGGHVRVGPVVVYGFNAMHVAVNVATRLGSVCFHPGWGGWRWYFYIANNGTPWGAWLAVGPGVDDDDKRRAATRRAQAIAWLHAVDSEYVRRVEQERDKAKARADTAERQLAEALAALGLFAHAYTCLACSGPDDGCDVGQALESRCIDDLGFDPHALGAACAREMADDQ